MGVATGLNFCPLFVGTFGPDENFTGFSSGMNNTARLQGVATRDEILCMDSFAKVYADATQFTEQRSALVKNVSEPLRYHPKCFTCLRCKVMLKGKKFVVNSQEVYCAICQGPKVKQ